MNLTPDQSQYVLNSLVAQGKVRLSQIRKALKGRQQEIRQLRQKLASLEGLGRDGAPGGARSAARRRGRRPAARRVRKMSGRVRALRRLQGKYMGYVRRLKAAEKARVRSVREKQGMQEAIRLAASLASKA